MSDAPIVRADRIWSDSTVVCLATGPSLCAEDVAYVHGKARVIAVNDAYVLAPWADVLYATDVSWWNLHRDRVKALPGDFWSLAKNWTEAAVRRHPRVRHIGYSGESGFDPDPSFVRTGTNSGYVAIHLAAHFGARRIVLLGYDMAFAPDGTQHFFGAHPNHQVPNVEAFRPYFPALAEALLARGIEIVNASRRTALTCFPCRPLPDALSATDTRAA